MALSNTITELKHLLENITQEAYEAEQPTRILDYNNTKQKALKLKIQGLTQQLLKDTQHTEGAELAQKLHETDNITEKIQLLDKLAGLSITMQHAVRVPNDIKDEIEADMHEIHQCINHQCYRSAVILCGRILETALHRKYYEISGVDLLEKAPGTGLGNLVGKLNDKNVDVDPGLMNQIHLINQVRIHSVHKKQQPFRPSAQQTQAILLYTKDVIEKLFH